MFDFRALDITDDDISFVEDYFGFKFNDGQKKVLRYLDSTDIQACPGSGKTTTLAAKLIILARKIPKSFRQGVCVITHTNVAVEEIKSKLGIYSHFYSSYPNHFGTIQSVVDKYFTIPAFKNEFKQSPKIIDASTYCKEINKFHSLKGTSLFLSSRGIDEIGYLSYNRINFQISRNINDEIPFCIPNINAEKMAVHYTKIKKAKDNLYKEGYIKYEEAYSLAFKYLRENPQLKYLFTRRFPLVFIDEMQDMESHQSELISFLCDGSSVIIQKIGDVNQSIYNLYSSDDQKEWRPLINHDLQLTESARISENIVLEVKDICIAPQLMTGWSNLAPLKPTLILFDDNSIQNVKNKFGELLIRNNLHKGKPCKAIGARLSESKLNINSYWREFNRGNSGIDFSNIKSFIENAKQLSIKTKNVKDTRNVLLSIICKCLRLCKVKNPYTTFYFTPFTLSNYLNSLNDLSLLNKLNNFLSKWIVSISNTEIIRREIESFVSELLPMFESQVQAELKQFYADSEFEQPNEKDEKKTYTFSYDGQDVKIYFDTIHGAKGETHAATLYLETYTNKVYDVSGRILDFVIFDEKKKEKKRMNDNALKKRLPLAYVALTRATHFICLAVHKDRFTEKHRSFFENNPNWDIISI